MTTLQRSELERVEVVARIANSNPFLGERRELERRILDRLGVANDADVRARLSAIAEYVGPLAAKVREHLVEGKPSERLIHVYRDFILFVLYTRYRQGFDALLTTPSKGASQIADLWERFSAEVEHFFAGPAMTNQPGTDAAHLFACAWQIRRAFHQIDSTIAGRSEPTARLKGAIWQSIFTHRMPRHWQSLHARMGEFCTLITGPSGTGKELVARAIALSRYIPFDEKRRVFETKPEDLFHPINLSALSPTLIESELFGHRRGAFTGAQSDRPGWFELCHPLGTVFLDEIGDVDLAIQVKLLRVIETRSFHPLGDGKPHTFRGKVTAATHRDLEEEIRAGRFREDMYYRLCADMIEVPSLAERLRDDTAELETLVRHLARRVVESETESLTAEVLEFIARELGPDYAWPGNIRELDQCVRNVLIRGHYRPPRKSVRSGTTDLGEELAEAIERGSLTAEDLLRRYCRAMYERTKSFEEVARRLDLDRRTVKAKIEAK